MLALLDAKINNKTMAERWFDRDAFRIPLAIAAAAGVGAVAVHKGFFEGSSSQVPKISYEGQLINGLRAVDDGNWSTTFNASGLRMRLVPPVVELGLKDILHESAKPIEGDELRALALDTCAVVAINNPGTETADNSATALALSEGINTIVAGEESEALAEKEAGKNNRDSAKLKQDARGKYSHAAAVCLRSLEKSSTPIKVPVGTK
jgi:hypothetical protein